MIFSSIAVSALCVMAAMPIGIASVVAIGGDNNDEGERGSSNELTPNSPSTGSSNEEAAYQGDDQTLNKQLYPDMENFLKALQDPGTPKKGDTSGAFVHNKLKRFAAEYYKKVMKPLANTVPELSDLPATDALVITTITKCILIKRVQKDLTTLHTDIRKYAP